jgi:amino acid transporter
MSEQAKDDLLRRDIGFFGSAFLSFNGVVGAGIFALPGTLYDKFGAFSPFLFPLFGLLVLLVALPFARVAAHHRVSGGPVVYAAAFGPGVAFQAGWLYYVARAAALAANTTVLVTYLATFWPPLAAGLPRALVILAVTGLIVAVNILGVKKAVRLLDGLTLLKAAPLLFVALLGLIVGEARSKRRPRSPSSATSRRRPSSCSMLSWDSKTASSPPARRPMRGGPSRGRSSRPSSAPRRSIS